MSPNETLNSIYDDASWCNLIIDNTTIILGTIYRSPSDNEACITINRLLNEASLLSNELLVVGDFNMRDIEWNTWTTIHSENHFESRFIECLRDNYIY